MRQNRTKPEPMLMVLPQLCLRQSYFHIFFFLSLKSGPSRGLRNVGLRKSVNLKQKLPSTQLYTPFVHFSSSCTKWALNKYLLNSMAFEKLTENKVIGNLPHQKKPSNLRIVQRSQAVVRQGPGLLLSSRPSFALAPRHP